MCLLSPSQQNIVARTRKTGVHQQSFYYTGFLRSYNNIVLQKVMNTCAVKIKWPLSVRLQDLLLLELEVLLFQVLASIILTAYSNIRPEVNQTSCSQFCVCANSPILHCCKNEENRCMHWHQCVYLIKTFHKSFKLFDGKMKLLCTIYSHQQLDIDYGF